VVVSFDLTCQADDNWYLSNRTQPDRYQPWYHILVHDSDQVTYAAQTSLEEDHSKENIVHPLLSHLFSAFHNGQYIRNDNPWPDQ
jgi:heat shock protein HspQ